MPPTNAKKVADEIAAEIAEREANRGKPQPRSVTDLTDGETQHARNGLDVKPPAFDDVVDGKLRDKMVAIRDRILALKGNQRWWESQLSYAQRVQLTGALVIVQELLQDKDNANIPITMGRYLGIALPHWPVS